MDKRDAITAHNPKLYGVNAASPLSIGNGRFAFTADVTGLQSLYALYAPTFPLCTMSEWGWHTTPNSHGGTFKHEDLAQTEYMHDGRAVYYPVEAKRGNEEVYHWLRHNPHKFNLGRVYFDFDGAVEVVEQELRLYEGCLYSVFNVDGVKVEVEAYCDDEDVLAFNIKTAAPLPLRISFPYGHHDMAAGVWDNAEGHESRLSGGRGLWRISRLMDACRYFVHIAGDVEADTISPHIFEIKGDFTNGKHISIGFSQTKQDNIADFELCKARSVARFKHFWEAVRLPNVTNDELRRRMILSLYLSFIQGAGDLPPAETGLSVNSWYGRFHLEMHFWHSAYMPLYNLSHLLLPSINWYRQILPKAQSNAAKNGYKGARWPKQVCPAGVDSPSPIAPLLVWQQPHISHMLELLYQDKGDIHFLEEYWELVYETTVFMVDFLHFNAEQARYELIAPLIPAQEEHRPQDVLNPTFELEYFRFGINIGIKWAQRLKMDNALIAQWQNVADNIAKPTVIDGLIMAHERCPDTFERYNRDHPSMLMAYGLLNSDIDPNAALQTLQKVLQCWDGESMWGWDFAFLAMTAAKLGLTDLATELLLKDSPKNKYELNGHNRQSTRADLPLYLPGNGALLLALALIC